MMSDECVNPTLLVCCDVFKSQIEKLGSIPADLIYLEQMLHRTPEKLRQELQNIIESSCRYKTILFAYGLCSNALVGLKSGKNQRLVIPKTDDCVGLTLGSREKYLSEFQKESGTYYFTSGWVSAAKDPLKEYWENIEKYGEEDAAWIAEEMLKHYTRAAFIKTNDSRDEASIDYVKQFVVFFKLNYVEIEGNDCYLRDLINGSWGDHFVVVENGDESKSELFI